MRHERCCGGRHVVTSRHVGASFGCSRHYCSKFQAAALQCMCIFIRDGSKGAQGGGGTGTVIGVQQLHARSSHVHKIGMGLFVTLHIAVHGSSG